MVAVIAIRWFQCDAKWFPYRENLPRFVYDITIVELCNYQWRKYANIKPQLPCQYKTPYIRTDRLRPGKLLH